MQHIFKNCGNFSVEVLSGMIRYPQETKKGRGRWNPDPASTDMADGYVTQEGDMIIGGFLHAECAQAAVREGRHFFGMSLSEKQELVTELCQKHLRSGNGPEFIAYAVQDWLKAKNIKALYIQSGSPWENAYIESFHDKLRNELLNRKIFVNLLEARVLTEAFRDEYN